MGTNYLDDIAEIVRRAEAAAYERGKADAKRELLEFLGQQGHSSEAATNVASTHRSEARRESNDRQRAPKGLVPRFVGRVLDEWAPLGITPQQILDAATTDHERMIKASSVRSTLRLGRERGEYRESGGLWFLNKEAEGRTSAGQPSASSHDEEGGDTHATAIE